MMVGADQMMVGVAQAMFGVAQMLVGTEETIRPVSSPLEGAFWRRNPVDIYITSVIFLRLWANTC